MKFRSHLALLIAWASLAALPGAAQAEPGSTTTSNGTAAATVADPMTVSRIADLRFGRFAAPTTASTMRVAPDGTVTPSAGVASSNSMVQPPDGRGPASFRVEMDDNRAFIAFIPRRVTISNGTSTMDVRNLGGRIVRVTNAGTQSVHRVDIGGTLNIDANQEAGRYSGDLTLTVLYL